MRGDRERLLDILEAIENIARRVGSDREVFFRDELLQVWAIHHIQIIGEAANQISKALQNRYSSIPWPDIVDMRNVLVHRYFGVDLQEVWDTLSTDLPNLKRAVEQILREIAN